jgi:16S rRNA C967 or C1407 C5-methylase (RsmB/RsmF family)/NOL1/NOP2/fmu family ribosome biogenesis protein
MSETSFFDLLSAHERDSFLESNQRHSPRAIRLRPKVAEADIPFATFEVPWYPFGRIVNKSEVRPSVYLEYAIGDYYIQDAGSLLALALLDARPNEIICDLCAAPGGKATGIVERLGAEGFLLANEPIGGRCGVLRYMLSRTGSLRYAISQCDPDVLSQRFANRFDAVVVDAPCSGQTMVASTKRDENAFDPKQVHHSAERQRRILRAAIRLLRSGGRLVYSTCTFAIEENEAQLRFLLDEYPGCFEVVRPERLQEYESPIEAGCYRLWPHRHPTAGAFGFMVRLVGDARLSEGDIDVGSEPKLSRRPKSRRHRANRLVLDDFGELEQTAQIMEFDEEIRAVTADIPGNIFEGLKASELVRLVSTRGTTLVPDHALGLMQTEWFNPRFHLDLNRKESSQVVSGKAIAFDGQRASDVRWAVARWSNSPLGWVKFAANRLNNHLPTAAILPSIRVD